MIWILLYLYAIGVLNDLMYAVSNDSDLKDWRVHANIAAWPLTVPLAVIYAVLNHGKE